MLGSLDWGWDSSLDVLNIFADKNYSFIREHFKQKEVEKISFCNTKPGILVENRYYNDTKTRKLLALEGSGEYEYSRNRILFFQKNGKLVGQVGVKVTGNSVIEHPESGFWFFKTKAWTEQVVSKVRFRETVTDALDRLNAKNEVCFIIVFCRGELTIGSPWKQLQQKPEEIKMEIEKIPA
jgi:hypothetical protein